MTPAYDGWTEADYYAARDAARAAYDRRGTLDEEIALRAKEADCAGRSRAISSSSVPIDDVLPLDRRGTLDSTHKDGAAHPVEDDAAPSEGGYER